MAQRVKVELIDDIDGTTADETITFALDGVTYELDLNHDNAAKLRDQLAPWTGHARRTSGRRPIKTTRKAAGSSESQAIRTWAEQQGIPVSPRGRISADVREAYAAAH